MEIAKYAASQKKHIISEKPLEVTVDRIDEMLKACEKNGVYIASIFHKRYHPVYKWIKKAVDEGRFGEIVSTDVLMKWYRPPEYYADSGWRGTWKLDGGGALMNQCIHFIDLMQWFNGGVDSVFARTANRLHKNIETEDTATGSMLFANGAFGLVEATTSSYPGFSTILTVNGTKGGVICENEAVRELKIDDETDEDRMIRRDSKFGEHGNDAGTNIKKDITLHLEQLKEMVDALIEGRQPPVEGLEARKAVEIVTAMYESARKGMQVRLGED
jgi:predicted dehydrogenase